MPFRVSESDATAPLPVLRVYATKTFQLREPFVYRDPVTNTDTAVPAHQNTDTTDLASVPSLLWGFIAVASLDVVYEALAVRRGVVS